MYRDIKNWRDLTDEELMQVFATFVAVNCLENNVSKELGGMAYGFFKVFIEHYSDVEKLKQALEVAKQIGVDPKEFLS